ncbi:FAD-dependent monooxygenase [Chromobacterium sp. TRC.1.1.SA]|uniref:FAD-dependent monooxygenase n=1 Tax=Chromobacterium indicum TaxID=3110228 RepID=A0ABV0CK24_9NEIS
MVVRRRTFERTKFDGNSLIKKEIVIAGAGLVGLVLALDLARRGVRTLVIDQDDKVSDGSRAIVFAKRSLEILGRLGLGEQLLEKGISWHLGKVLHGDRQLFEFNYLPEPGHQYPAFINLQQYYLEEWLIEACLESGLVEFRWGHRVAGVQREPRRAIVDVATDQGGYQIHCDWLVACDGVRSFVRQALQLPFEGRTFNDRFLIADVRMPAALPAERRFWFSPSFHEGQSVLIHKQPDDVWRVDFQLGPDADPVLEREPERVAARLRRMFGDGIDFKLEWVSVYTFRCRRLARFVHGPVVFAGDSAHEVSPFGGRGGNGGIQDADNLGWKLAEIIAGRAGPALLDSYGEERGLAADENILNSSRSADFITPRSERARLLKEAVLLLSAEHEAIRPMVNSGRLSRPASLAGCCLLQPAGHREGPGPGDAALDAPVLLAGQPAWLLERIGNRFTLLYFVDGESDVDAAWHFCRLHGAALLTVGRSGSEGGDGRIHVVDDAGLAHERYRAAQRRVYLIRPDQHICYAADLLDTVELAAALRLALGHSVSSTFERRA